MCVCVCVLIVQLILLILVVLLERGRISENKFETRLGLFIKSFENAERKGFSLLNKWPLGTLFFQQSLIGFAHSYDLGTREETL